jgi:hypothetical protein
MSYFTRVLKVNPYHDPKSGRFTTGPKGGGGKLSSPAGMKYTPPKKGAYASTDPMTGERIENEFERTPTGQYARYERHSMDDKKTFLEYLTPTQFRNKMRMFRGEVFA